ncbi:MAG: hypothetical protein V9E96_15415 [Chitinophagaceae bacterium]
MKKILLATTLLVALQTMAQSDTTKTDTVKAGNFIIVKKEKKVCINRNQYKKRG